MRRDQTVGGTLRQMSASGYESCLQRERCGRRSVPLRTDIDGDFCARFDGNRNASFEHLWLRSEETSAISVPDAGALTCTRRQIWSQW